MDNLNTRGNVSNKPRRTRGTPSYKIRNYFAYSVLAAGALFGFIYHQWPETQKFKKAIEGKFKYTGSEKERYLYMSLARRNFSFTAEDEPEEEGENPHPNEKISSYFSSSTLTDSSSQSASEVSNTESQCSPILIPDDENDFAETTVKPSKAFEIKIKKESIVTKKRTRNKNNLSRFIKDLGPSCSDTHQEHLQLALALSRSLEEFKNPEQNSEHPEGTEYQSTQQKIATVKKTLEQFGFKSDRTAIKLPELPPLKNNTRQKKKLKFITPTLFLRTEEDRKKLIENKVSAILNSISVYNKNLEETEQFNDKKDEFLNNKPRSFLLRDFYDENSTIFRKNHLSLSEIHESTFYNKTVPQEIVKPGTLLKDWGSIPGRERSPPIDITVEETDELQEWCSSTGREKNTPIDIIVEETEELQEGSSIPGRKKGPSIDITIEETEEPQEEQRNVTPNLFSESYSATSSQKSNSSKINEELQEWYSNPGREKSPPIDIIVAETEEPQKEHRSVSPDLFSESDSDKSPQKSNSSKMNKDLSPIIILNNSNKIGNSPVLSEKELFSDDSDVKSLSLLDNISPHRYKNRSPKKSLNSAAKKSLFAFENSKLNGISELHVRNKENSSQISSVFNSFPQQSQICHFESFCDNSNDVFDLTRSSDDSNDIFTANTIVVDQNLTEMGQHDDNYSAVIQAQKNMSPAKQNSVLIDLTQSSTDSKDSTLKIISKDLFSEQESYSFNVEDDCNPDDLEGTVLVQNQSTSNVSIKTVLFTTKNIEETEEIETVLLQNNKTDKELNDSIISDSESENYEPCLSYINIKNTRSRISNKSLNKSFDATPKRHDKSLKRSFSENVIGDKELQYITPDKTDFFKISSPLNVTNLLAQTSFKNSTIIFSKDIEMSDEELDETRELEAKNKSYEFLSQSSIETCSDISDEELNYSTNISIRRRINTADDKHEKHQLMDFNDLPDTGFEPSDLDEILNSTEILKHPRVNVLKTPKKIRKSFSERCISSPLVKTPENSKIPSISITPNSDLIIKTTNVTPVPNYSQMDSSELKKELDKFGIKPMKRAKGIKLLRYIYEATHPILQGNPEKIVNSSSDEEDNRIIKRRKMSLETKNSKKLEEMIDCTNNEIAESEKLEEMIFERKQSVKIKSCRLPLHIAWHNLLSSDRELHEKILVYQPIKVEEIYSKFKSFGFKFHIQDIISFLDKKCVTIKVAQNNHPKKKAGS